VCSPWAEVAVFTKDTGEVTVDPQNPTQNGLKLYTLYLRQKVAIPDNALVAQLNGGTRIPYSQYGTQGNYVEVSCQHDDLTLGVPNGSLYFNNPQDLTMPARRMGAGGGAIRIQGWPLTRYLTLADEPNAAANGTSGNDVLLTDVLSFDVRVLLQGQPDFLDLYGVQNLFPNKNPSIGGVDFRGLIFDTWSQMRDNNQNLDYGTNWNASAGTSQLRIPIYDDANGNRIRIRAIQITIRIWDSRTLQARQTSIVQDL
jgi:hypothetical protein